ncbi:hypothetical protein MSAN_00307000 [Mycena sanguinolenta]|uniref:Uncharacterized protein n=1 Tax=Mycena sanguinolenta TaxID=230812 RepID=A0A8H6ZDE6_9AGAR|nr:hypothetical protein MSAN_00307000 [Mycena sanguinolenta]
MRGRGRLTRFSSPCISARGYGPLWCHPCHWSSERRRVYDPDITTVPAIASFTSSQLCALMRCSGRDPLSLFRPRHSALGIPLATLAFTTFGPRLATIVQGSCAQKSLEVRFDM